MTKSTRSSSNHSISVKQLDSRPCFESAQNADEVWQIEQQYRKTFSGKDDKTYAPKRTMRMLLQSPETKIIMDCCSPHSGGKWRTLCVSFRGSKFTHTSDTWWWQDIVINQMRQLPDVGEMPMPEITRSHSEVPRLVLQP